MKLKFRIDPCSTSGGHDTNFRNLFNWRRAAFTSTLRRIPVDQWEEVLNPLMGLRYATFSRTVQPFYFVFWCFQMLLLSCRGELRAQGMPNSAGMPYHCLLHSQQLVCAGCCHLYSSTFVDHADQTLILKNLMMECIETAFSIAEEDCHSYVSLINYFEPLNLILIGYHIQIDYIWNIGVFTPLFLTSRQHTASDEGIARSDHWRKFVTSAALTA